MSVDARVLVGRRSRAEIERLVALYGSSGMGRMEFCRSHGLALSTLGRHMRKQRSKHSESRSKGVEQGRLVPVEVAAPVASIAAGKVSAAAIVLSINGRRVEVGSGFDAATLAQLVTVLERL
jgi:transposase-like protein